MRTPITSTPLDVGTAALVSGRWLKPSRSRSFRRCFRLRLPTETDSVAEHAIAVKKVNDAGLHPSKWCREAAGLRNSMFVRIVLPILALAWPYVPAWATVPKKSVTPAEAVLEKVQHYYDQTKDYTADFIQLYTRTALSRTAESSGTVMIKKPGMMRWEYTKPENKLFITDGTQLFVYEPEEEQVVIDSHFKTAELSTSISFLWGEGKLADAFTPSLSTPDKYDAPKGTTILELVPKKDATYTKLVLVLDPKTHQVQESILYETAGNVNRFKFKNMKMNPSLKDDLFKFSPPPNVEIIRR
jgi:outer membrane lipoprotein carrier protein